MKQPVRRHYVFDWSRPTITDLSASAIPCNFRRPQHAVATRAWTYQAAKLGAKTTRLLGVVAKNYDQVAEKVAEKVAPHYEGQHESSGKSATICRYVHL